ncbi:hypothetical protein CBL_12484 [Carabus blaptoides fortunei]
MMIARHFQQQQATRRRTTTSTSGTSLDQQQHHQQALLAVAAEEALKENTSSNDGGQHTSDIQTLQRVPTVWERPEEHWRPNTVPAHPGAALEPGYYACAHPHIHRYIRVISRQEEFTVKTSQIYDQSITNFRKEIVNITVQDNEYNASTGNILNTG